MFLDFTFWKVVCMKNIWLELNKIHLMDCIEWMKKLKDESVDLIIADPPYRKVIGESWDYKRKTEEEYIDRSLEWITQAHRVLRKWGTFYLFWYFRTLCKLVCRTSQLGFDFRQQIVINKWMRSVSWRATKNYKIFPNVTESLLYFVKDSYPFVKNLLKTQQKNVWIMAKEINKMLGVKDNWWWMRSIYTWENVCKQIPTRENWEMLKKILQFDVDYDHIWIVFNPEMWITDVWNDIDFYEEKRIHPTQKPLKLINRLIKASSNEWMLVLDPFMWSWATAFAAKWLNRKYVWFELDEKYFNDANKRLANDFWLFK